MYDQIAKFLPVVETPAKRPHLAGRFYWTVLTLFLFLALSYVPVYGLTQAVGLGFIETVLGATFGSLATLGIGPIVTGSLILQLLVGSKILEFDMSKEEDRKKFGTLNKLAILIFCFLEAFAFLLGRIILVEPGMFLLVGLQIALGGILIMLLDELVSKYGIGSGVSLFILVGVCKGLFLQAFLPLTGYGLAPSLYALPHGLVWRLLANLYLMDFLKAVLAFIPLFTTLMVFLFIVYIQDAGIDLPLTFGIRGFGRDLSLKLLYTSVIPIILLGGLTSMLILTARTMATPTLTGFCGPLGCFDRMGNPISGLIYFLTPPTGFLTKVILGQSTWFDLIRILTYGIFMVIGATLFSILWINTAGMDANSVAEQIYGMKILIPGFRADKKSLKELLERYIPWLAVISGILMGSLVVMADVLQVIGTGTGLLLATMIAYNYSEIVKRERELEAFPWLSRLIK